MAQTYQPLQPNQAPAFGTSGQAVADLQHNYNVQNAGLPGWTPLAEDGQYGPLTQAGVAWKPNNLVVTGGSAAGQFNANSNTLDTMLGSLNQLYGPKGKTPTLENTNDAYTQMLDRMSATSDLATKALIGTIQAQRSQQASNINAQYDNYKRGLQMLGIQSNSAQSTPDLLLGHVQQAENEHQAKIQALDVEINKALMDAQIAKDNKDLSVLKEKMDYVKQLKQEQQDYLKNIASQMSAGSSIAESIIAGDYDMFQTLSSSEQSAYIKTLASSFGIPEQLIQGAINQEKASRVKKSTGGSSKPLSILDVQRYNDLYPDAGVIAGDSEATANAKVNKTNTPEAQTRNLIQTIFDNGTAYDDVVAEINSDDTISDKASALAIAKEVYGIGDTSTETSPKGFVGTRTTPEGTFVLQGIGRDIAKIQIEQGIFSNSKLKKELAKMGYTKDEIDAEFDSNSIFDFLFN